MITALPFLSIYQRLDTVDHEILLQRLNNVGLSNHLKIIEVISNSLIKGIIPLIKGSSTLMFS